MEMALRGTLKEQARGWAQIIERNLEYSRQGGPGTVLAFNNLIAGFTLEQCEILDFTIRAEFPSGVMQAYAAKELADTIYIKKLAARHTLT